MSNDEAEQIIGLHGTLPRLVVFDLDYTLWPFYCDLFHEDHAPDPYPHALGILHALKARGIDMAIASRSRTPEIARLFLEKLGVRSMFVAEVRRYSPVSHTKLSISRKSIRKLGYHLSQCSSLMMI
ncbi:magnesium-dependent phosphatase 1 [Olea europaea subsp. europaea]|uniref:Magnesium-dependent phosphatase 1 n=1 Tax=Olea europaea subsp. europaea TaxID=158383 RepID=A0A8S0V685_OLEEU|nr:magnesium-dependent phosphatase 1 [Olea europaea subsp. europaea]